MSSATLTTALFKRLALSIALGADKPPSGNPVWTGVRVEVADRTLTLAATDRHVLLSASVGLPVECDRDAEFSVTLDAVQLAAAVRSEKIPRPTGHAEELVNISADGILTWGTGTLVSGIHPDAIRAERRVPVIGGDYVNWRLVMTEVPVPNPASVAHFNPTLLGVVAKSAGIAVPNAVPLAWWTPPASEGGGQAHKPARFTSADEAVTWTGVLMPVHVPPKI